MCLFNLVKIKVLTKRTYLIYQLCKVSFILGYYKMTTKQLNIKNRTYYFYNDLINIANFEVSNLKLDKKTSSGLDIYYIGYADKKPEWNVNSVNPLYLMINRIDGFFEEKNGVKYLNIADTVRNNEYLMISNTISKKLMKVMENMTKIT